MAPTRWQALVLAGLATGLGGWLVWRLVAGQGGTPPEVPWTVTAALATLAGIVFWLGWTVRQYQHGKRPDLDPIRAARTAVLGKAAAYTGSLLAGWYGSQGLVLALDSANEPMRANALTAGLAALVAVGLAVVGVVVEGFCRLPPPGEDDGTDTGEVAVSPTPS